MERRFFRNLVITNFIQSLTLSITGLIDTAVVGRCLGEDGLSAMKLAMPVFTLLALFSFVLGSGLSVTLSRELSAGHTEKAQKIFQSVFTLAALIGIVFILLGLANPPILKDIFAGSYCTALIRTQTGQYLRPILMGALAILMYDVLGNIVMLGGASNYLKMAAAVLFGLDIAGDLLAVRLGLGVAGIAAASSVAYLGATAVILRYFADQRALLKLGLSFPSWTDIHEVVLRGLPLGVTLICGILLPLFINRMMLTFGTIKGLAALSIQDTVRYVPGALTTGISNAALILTGMYAAEYDHRALAQVRRSILLWSFLAGFALSVILMVLASPAIWAFTVDSQIHALGLSSLLWYMPGIPFIALNSSIRAFLQGLGQRGPSISFSIMENFLAPAFFAWFLGRAYGNPGIYASYPISQIFTCVLFAVSVYLALRRNRHILPEELRNGIGGRDMTLEIHSEEDVMEASRMAGELCREEGFDRRLSYHVALTVEELAMNSLIHGFDDKKPHHLEIRLLITREEMILRLRDDGRPFDLTRRYQMINPEDPTKNIGLRIIFAGADEVTYHSSMNLNNVCVRIRRDPSSEKTEETA